MADIAAPAGPAHRVADAGPRSQGRPSSIHDVSAAASPAADAASIDARCGGDQRPAYRAPPPDPGDGMIHIGLPVADPDGVLRHLPGEIKPAGVGYTGAMRRIDAALRSSGDPFDRAVADELDLAQVTPPALRTEALVQDALAANDFRVYSLAFAACHPGLGEAPGSPAPSTGCARLSTARWAQLDPGDAQPWLWALADADKRGDVAAQREALARIAASSHLNLRSQAGMAAVARLPLADADLAAQSDAAVQALSAGPPSSALTARCVNHAGGDAEVAATCDRIATMLYEHADSLLWHRLGGSLHKLVTGDASWLERARREQQAGFARPAASPADGGPCSAQREALRDWVRQGEVGDMALLHEALRAASAP